MHHLAERVARDNTGLLRCTSHQPDVVGEDQRIEGPVHAAEEGPELTVPLFIGKFRAGGVKPGVNHVL